MPWIIGFLGDVRGFYPTGYPEWIFPSKFSDLPTLHFAGSYLFEEVYESYISWGFKGVGGGFRYFGTLDSLFSDYGAFIGGRIGYISVGIYYTVVKIGGYMENDLGGVLSSGRRTKTFDVWISGGYLYTPFLAFEGSIKGNYAGLMVSSLARPGIYTRNSVSVYLEFENMRIGGIYINFGNTFGMFITYYPFFGRLSFSFLYHEALGENFTFDNFILIPR